MTPRVVLLELAHLLNKVITALQHFVKITIIYDNRDFKKRIGCWLGFFYIS